jgi:uncharacterized protein
MRTIVAGLTALLLAVPLPAAAQPRAPLPPPAPTVSVNGEGVVTRTPDRATVTLQIVTNNDAATAATSQNNTIYGTLRSRLGAIGIVESAIHTNSFGMTFVPKPVNSTDYHPPRTGYVVTRSLGITVDNLDVVGRTIDAAVAAGITDLGGVSYGLRDQRAAYSIALAAAVKDAEAQASAIAEAAHMHLGALRNVNAGGFVAPLPGPVFRAAAQAAAPLPTEIQPSNITVRATVSATYRLTP